MTVYYPDRLPLPQLSDYSIEPDDVIARTEMEGGAARQRRRFTQAPTKNNVSFIFTTYEMMLFEAWYKHQAKEGAEWVKIKLLSSMGVVEQDARITKTYKGKTLSHMEWQVRAILEVRERPILTEGELLIVLENDPYALGVTADALHAYVHTHLTNPAHW